MSAKASTAEYRLLPSRRGVIDEASRDCTLYVGNLNPRVTEYHLMQLFGQFGELIRVQFTWHHHGEHKGKPKGFAFVEFVNKDDAALAAAQAHGVELAGKRMTVRFTEDQDRNADAPTEKLNVDYKTTAERRSNAIGARASQLEGGGGGRGGFSGGRGGGGAGRGGYSGGNFGGGGPENKFAYVAAPIPSSGFHVSAHASRAPKLVALEKIRAIEDKLVAMEAEQRMERREAQRKTMDVDHITKPAAQQHHSHAAHQHHHRQQSPPRDRAPTADQRGEQRRGDSPRRSGFVHPDRRRSRSRSRERDQHRGRH